MKRRCGFMLVNILIVIALMGAFAVVADRVFRLSLQTSSKVAREQEESIRLEQAIKTLRADVWSARNVEATGTSGLRITDARAGTWSDGKRRRTATWFAHRATINGSGGAN